MPRRLMHTRLACLSSNHGRISLEARVEEGASDLKELVLMGRGRRRGMRIIARGMNGNDVKDHTHSLPPLLSGRFPFTLHRGDGHRDERATELFNI